MGPTQSKLAGLDPYDGLGWVGFFFNSTMVGWIEKTFQPILYTPLNNTSKDSYILNVWAQLFYIIFSTF